MSINVQQRQFRQRKLGIVRQSHLPVVPVERTRRAQTAQPIGSRNVSTSSLDFHYREKLQKLRQVRLENAKMDSTSSYNSITGEEMNEAAPKKNMRFRCFTAPSRGSENKRNMDRFNSSLSLATNGLFEKYLINHCSEKEKETSCNNLKKLDSTESNPQNYDGVNMKPSPPNMGRRNSGSCKRISKHYSSFQSMRNALADVATTKIERTKSAPTHMFGTANQHVDVPEVKHEQLDETKRDIHSPLLSRRRKHVTPSSSFAKIHTTRGGLIRLDEGPLDVVGRPWSPRRPPKLIRNHYRTPSVSFRRSVSVSVKIPEKELTVPPDPPPSPKTLCLVPAPTKQCSSCHCRSVRFSCSDNLVHEFKANEPIAIDSEVFK